MLILLMSILIIIINEINSETTKHFSYEVIETIKHPPHHFTQGFTFRLSDGSLLEGTGLEGQSILTVYSMSDNGLPIQPKYQVNIPSKHFGEGIAELLGKLYQLTWKNRKVYVWDSESLGGLEARTMPHIMTEGWGMATSPGHDALIMTEGSAKLFWVYPDATPDGGFLFQKEVIVKDCLNIPKPHLLGGLNELETVPLHITHPEEVKSQHTSEGSPNFEQAKTRPFPSGATVWANVYGTHCIAIIDPVKGDVKGYIHLDGLNPDANQFNQVTNGIAYRAEDDSIWVTGKNWANMYKIKLKLLDQAPQNFPHKCLTTWNYPLGVTPRSAYGDVGCGKNRPDL